MQGSRSPHGPDPASLGSQLQAGRRSRLDGGQLPGLEPGALSVRGSAGECPLLCPRRQQPERRVSAAVGGGWWSAVGPAPSPVGLSGGRCGKAAAPASRVGAPLCHQEGPGPAPTGALGPLAACEARVWPAAPLWRERCAQPLSRGTEPGSCTRGSARKLAWGQLLDQALRRLASAVKRVTLLLYVASEDDMGKCEQSGVTTAF